MWKCREKNSTGKKRHDQSCTSPEPSASKARTIPLSHYAHLLILICSKVCFDEDAFVGSVKSLLFVWRLRFPESILSPITEELATHFYFFLSVHSHLHAVWSVSFEPSTLSTGFSFSFSPSLWVQCWYTLTYNSQNSYLAKKLCHLYSKVFFHLLLERCILTSYVIYAFFVSESLKFSAFSHHFSVLIFFEFSYFLKALNFS